MSVRDYRPPSLFLYDRVSIQLLVSVRAVVVEKDNDLDFVSIQLLVSVRDLPDSDPYTKYSSFNTTACVGSSVLP